MILAYVLVHQLTSITIISTVRSLSRTRVYKIVHENGAHPYHASQIEAQFTGDTEGVCICAIICRYP